METCAHMQQATSSTSVEGIGFSKGFRSDHADGSTCLIPPLRNGCQVRPYPQLAGAVQLK